MERLRYLARILGKRRFASFLLVLFVYFFTDSGILVLPVLYGQILNITEQTRMFPMHKFLLYLGLTILLFSVRAVAHYLNGLQQIDFFERISVSALRNLLFVPFDSISSKGREYYSDIVLNKSLDAASLFNIGSMTGFINLLRLTVITVVIFFLDAIVGVVSVALIVVSVLIYKYGTEYFMKGYSNYVERNKIYLSNVDDIVKNREEVIAFDAVRSEKKRNDSLTENLRRIRYVLLSKDFIHFFVELDFTRIFYELFVFVWSLHSVYAGRYPIGTGLVLIGYGAMITEPISYLNSVFSAIRKNLNSAGIVASLSGKNSKLLAFHEPFESLLFDRVSLIAGGRRVFENLSFSVKRGEKVSLIGPSGAGKSSVVSLILKDREKSSGRILMNGKQIESIPKKQILHSVSVLSQNSALFPGTVKENVTLGASVSEDFLNNLLKLLHVPFGPDYKIDANTENLSQGEKARILLARVIAAGREFMILDEPLEGVDEKTRNEILVFLKKYVRGKTLLLITHKTEIAEFLTDKIVWM